jgi:hypothetical protein
MAHHTQRTELAQLAQATGVYIATHAPGDGVRRYRFFATSTDFHAGDGEYTALGRAEAVTFLRGLLAGQQAFRHIGR